MCIDNSSVVTFLIIDPDGDLVITYLILLSGKVLTNRIIIIELSQNTPNDRLSNFTRDPFFSQP